MLILQFKLHDNFPFLSFSSYGSASNWSVIGQYGLSADRPKLKFTNIFLNVSHQQLYAVLLNFDVFNFISPGTGVVISSAVFSG